jgi:hypothetical protein
VPVDNGGTLPPPLVSGVDTPGALAVDSTAIYWVLATPNGAVMKLAR